MNADGRGLVAGGTTDERGWTRIGTAGEPQRHEGHKEERPREPQITQMAQIRRPEVAFRSEAGWGGRG